MRGTNAPETHPEFLIGGRPIIFAGDASSADGPVAGSGEESSAGGSVAGYGADAKPAADSPAEPDVFEYVTGLVFDQAELAGSRATNAAQQLLAAAIELLPQKKASRGVLSATHLFMAAVIWGNRRSGRPHCRRGSPGPPPSRAIAGKLIDRLQSFASQLLDRKSCESKFKMPTDLNEYKRIARQVGRYSFDWNMLLPDEAGVEMAGDLIQ